MSLFSLELLAIDSTTYNMKFLCLHGMGTNSSIFESQLGSTLPYLEAQGHEFVFVDGLIECAPAEGEATGVLVST